MSSGTILMINIDKVKYVLLTGGISSVQFTKFYEIPAGKNDSNLLFLSLLIYFKKDENESYY